MRIIITITNEDRSVLDQFTLDDPCEHENAFSNEVHEYLSRRFNIVEDGEL